MTMLSIVNYGLRCFLANEAARQMAAEQAYKHFEIFGQYIRRQPASPKAIRACAPNRV